MVPRVALDGRDVLRKRTGVVNNTLHLARELTAAPPSDVLVFVDQPATADEQAAADVPLRRLSAPPILWKHVALPLALARENVDVFHSPTGTLPLWSPCRQVVTIHDLFAAIEPAWFTPRMAWQLRSTQRRAAHAAAAVIAVSETTRRDLIERYAAPAERARVVYNGG